MHIAFVGSECVPYSKTGGLADVVGALPKALAALGHQISVFVPRYQNKPENPPLVLRSISIPYATGLRFCSIRGGETHDGVTVYFVDYPPFFLRDGIYGDRNGDFPDNADRFSMLCRAAIEACKVLGIPQIFHCHDWQTGLIPVMLKTVYAEDWCLRNIATVFTIHNIGYQGVFAKGVMRQNMLPESLLDFGRMEYYGNPNFLKGGIVYSDLITTVSRKYAQEIQTEEYGFEMDGVLRLRYDRLWGILNGVDYDEWNPETDPYTATPFSADDLAGKQACRADLLRTFGLNEDDSRPIIGIVARFAGQKGFDLVLEAAEELMREDFVLVVLGSGERRYEDMFRRWQAFAPERVGVRIAYDNGLAHKIEAGSDMFLMPSRYEPCGLNQIYSLRYGTVPIVRATGGLDDTVQHWVSETREGTGFKFYDYTSAGLVGVIREALWKFSDKAGWTELMKNGMKQDFSWSASAREYVRAYERARELHG